MLKEERQNEIIRIMKKYDYVTVDFLVGEIHYSPATIRRDLSELAEKGTISKSYGGASVINEARNVGIPYYLRLHKQAKEKVSIAKKSCELINENDTVFLDSSTSTSFMSGFLPEHKNITVVTNNLSLAAELVNNGFRVYAVGGAVIPPAITRGKFALEMLEKIHVDIMFFSAAYLDNQGNICEVESGIEFSQVCLKMLNNATKRVFLCDKGKLGKSTFYRPCDLNSVDYVICDTDVNTDLQNSFPATEFIKA